MLLWANNIKWHNGYENTEYLVIIFNWADTKVVLLSVISNTSISYGATLYSVDVNKYGSKKKGLHYQVSWGNGVTKVKAVLVNTWVFWVTRDIYDTPYF